MNLGSYWQIGTIENFDGKLIAEFLDAKLFHNLANTELKLIY